MKFSIIIPVHNAEKTIRKCAESILHQDYRDIEIILIENASEDDSLRRCIELQKEYPQITCIHTTESGVSAARNVGLAHAKSDIIGFCDADDYYCEGTLCEVSKIFEDKPDCGIVVGAFDCIYSDGSVHHRGISHSAEWNFAKLANHVLYDDNVFGSVWNKFFRGELLRNTFFDESLSVCEDTHFLIRLLCNNKKFKVFVSGYTCYCYVQSEESITNTTSKLFDENGRLKYITSYLRILSDCKLSKYQRLLARRKICEFAMRILLSGTADDCGQGAYLRRMVCSLWTSYFLTSFLAPVRSAKIMIKYISGT